MKNFEVSRTKRIVSSIAGAVLLALNVTSVWAGALDTLAPGYWYQAPSSNLSALDPCPASNCGYSGIEGHPAVMDSWSGGAYDTTRDRLIVWGGGHNAYAGNEIYVFNITSMTWSRATEPSSTVSQNAMYYPDGKPSSRHTYNMLVYAPNVDRFIAVGAGSTYGETGGSGSSVDAFDFSSNTWSTRASIPSAAGYAAMYGSVAAYDAGNGHIWFHDTLSGTLREYDPVANTWQVRVSNYLEDYSTAAVDPIRRVMVTVGGKSGILVWNLNSPTSAPTKPATTGDKTIEGAQAPGFVYDSASKLFVGWDGGTAVYTLNPSTWVWTKVNPAAGNTVTPTTSEARGTYGRFQYIPSKNVFVGVNRTTESVYFYRLSSGTTTAPTVTLAASATSVSYSGATTLTWSSTSATSCTASGGWSGTKSISGSAVISAITADTTFTLSCSGAGGSASSNAAVTVTGAPPTVSFSASPASVTSGGSSTLTWASTSATSCTASGAWSGAKATTGTLSLSSLTTSGSYTLTCAGAGGSASQSTAISVSIGAAPTGVTTLKAINQIASAQSNVPTTFGHYFKVGDIPSGLNLSAKLSDGTPLVVQVDKKATHGDGSLKHAVLTLNVPSLSSSGSQIFTLYTDAAVAASPAVTLSNLLATTFDAQVSLDVGGTVYSAAAKNLLSTTTPISWLSGAQVSEWIVGGPVKTSGGTAHPHLTAYFHVRAYAGTPITRVRVDAVVENNWTFRSGATAFSYVPTVSVGGTTIYNNGGASLTHYHHSRWHQVGWWGSNPQVYVQPDTQYLRDSKAVPNYANLSLQSSLLSSYTQSIAPMSNANLRVNWGDTGYSEQIGVLPGWDASFVISGGDIRAYNATLTNSSAGGSYGYHYRDEATGYPVSIDSYPSLSEQNYSAGMVEGTGGNAYSHEPGADPAAHQPMLGYLAYLLSGDYFYLEEMQFLANYNMVWNSTGRRTHLSGPQDGIVGYQNRGQAWGIRTLGFAATLTPDSHPLKNYLVNKTNNNIAEKTANWASPAQNSLGAIQDFDWISGYTVPPKYSPWQNDFFVMVFNRLVDLGFSNATTMRDWLNQWPVGRLGGNSGTSGFCWKYATQYGFNAGIVDGAGGYAASFTQLYQRNFPTESGSACPTSGLMQAGAYPTVPDAYYSNLQAALAMAVDAGAATQGLWDKFVTMGTPDYTGTPVWAIVPRPISGTPAPTVMLSSSPSSVTSGGSATLAWSATSATSCTASGAWSGTKATSGSEVINSITSTSTFTLNCSGAGGSGSQSVTVAVIAPAPTVTLSASPASVTSGASSTLTWSSTNASSCAASNAWSGAMAISGTQTLSNRTSTGTYTLTCTGTGGSASQNATITVTAAAPTTTISASPASVAYGGSSTLTWSSTGATSCTASGAWSGTKATSGSQALSSLTTSGGYTLTCSGAGGTSNQTSTITVAAAPPIPTVTISASPASIAYNGSTTLTWSSTDAASCTAAGGWSGSKAVSGSQTLSPLTSSATYLLSCSNVTGSGSQSVSVTVAAPPATTPSVTLNASPTSVSSGGSSTLTWSSTDVTSCTASGNWSGAKAVSGTQTFSNLTSSGSYTLTCTGTGGSASRTASVVVVPVPTVTISASSASTAYNGSTTLTWSSTNAASCTASGGWSGSKAVSGSQTLNLLTSSATYLLSCSNVTGSGSQSVSVTVAAPPATMPAVTLNASPMSVASGGSSTLTWSSTDVTSCTASGNWSGAKAISGTQTFNNITSNMSYTLTCTGSGGSATHTASVAVLSVPTITISASPTSVAFSGASTLTWSSTNSTACTASGGWSGAKTISGSEPFNNLSISTTFTLTCTGPGGSVTGNTTVAVAPAPPSVAISATPASVDYFGSATLTWASSNATSCTGSGAWSGGKATAGSEARSGLTTSAIYTITCSGPSGSVSQSVTVNVTTPGKPKLAMSARGKKRGNTVTAGVIAVPYFDEAILSWEATDASSCTASGQWSGSKGTTGSESTGVLQVTSSYTLTCDGPGGSSSQTVVVEVGEAGVDGGAPPPAAGSPSATKVGGGALNLWLLVVTLMALLARGSRCAAVVRRY